MNTEAAMKAKDFAFILGRDVNDKPNHVICVGTGAKLYQVKITREDGKFLVACYKSYGWQPNGTIQGTDEPCDGNSHNHVCYHCLAALLHIADESKVESVMVPDENFANKHAEHIGGFVAPVLSVQGNGVCWNVYKPGKRRKAKEREPGEEG